MFIELLSICTIVSFSVSLVSNSRGPIKCVSSNIQPCRARPTLVDINSNKTLFYSFNVSVNKCGESYNTINDPFARVCAPNKVKI